MHSCMFIRLQGVELEQENCEELLKENLNKIIVCASVLKFVLIYHSED